MRKFFIVLLGLLAVGFGATSLMFIMNGKPEMFIVSALSLMVAFAVAAVAVAVVSKSRDVILKPAVTGVVIAYLIANIATAVLFNIYAQDKLKVLITAQIATLVASIVILLIAKVAATALNIKK